MKQRTGYVYQNKNSEKWYARICYTKPNGKKSSIKRSANSKTEAKQVLKKLLESFETNGLESVKAERLTFNFLADFYEQHYAQPAQYSQGRKVAGLRSEKNVRQYVVTLREHFGNRTLRGISYEDVKAFQIIRLNTPTRNHKARSLTTVNRELACLRRTLNIAVRRGWLLKNPFQQGDTLIHAADEIKRERILTKDEESRLLKECEAQSTLLKSLVILALDTGCRQNELLQLTWNEVDFVSNSIRLLAFNTKTAKEREIGITARAKDELSRLQENYVIQGANTIVFPFPTRHYIRYYFQMACQKANIEGLRFHDLRHTHATRLDDLGFSLAKIGTQLGHTVLQTTLRYVNRDKESMQRIASALDSLNEGVAKSANDTESKESVLDDFSVIANVIAEPIEFVSDYVN